MDNFEGIIATLLEADHYWMRRPFKIDVTQEEKRQVGKHSIPRPEVDLLALSFSKNEVIAFEVKSFLNSPGVRLEDLQREHEVQEGRYKLFTSRGYREVVLARLNKARSHQPRYSGLKYEGEARSGGGEGLSEEE